jgi:hypothetical protein
MKISKRIWVTALCLTSATFLTVSLKSRPTAVQAAATTPVAASRAMSVQPVTHVTNTALRAAAVRNAMMLDNAGPARVSISAQRNSNPTLPSVEEFTLTPPNPAQQIYKTNLEVRFAGPAAEKLPAQIPFNLTGQHVVLQRSSNDPRVFSAQVDFDWQTFAKQQQQRKQLSNSGRKTPVFDGRHFLGLDDIHFVDPADIQRATQSHQSIQFTPQVLEPVIDVDPQTELMITDPNVVEDSTRTYDPCTNTGTKMGSWTFGALMLALSGQSNIGTADQMVQNWLNIWTQSRTVNGFSVDGRPGIQDVLNGNGTIAGWPQLAGTNNVDITEAPFQLNAIVNRIDIGEGPSPTGGELRLIFGYAPCPANNPQNTLEGIPQLFNIIFEYNVPYSGCTSTNNVVAWAKLWQQVETDFLLCNGGSFNKNCRPNPIADVEAITDQVVIYTPPTVNAQQNLAALRSNEDFMQTNGQESEPANKTWEMRQFALQFSGGPANCPSNGFCQVPVFETPQGDPGPTPGQSNNGGLGFNFGANYGASMQCENGCKVGSNGPAECTCNDQVLTDFINFLGLQLNFPGTYKVPTTFDDPVGTFNGAFQGASAFQPLAPKAFWNGSSQGHIGVADGRQIFSENTCNGCHGEEIQTPFQQVKNRQPEPLGGTGPQPQPAQLAAFLLGCSTANSTNCNSNGCPNGPLTNPCPTGLNGNTCTLQNVIGSSSCQNEVVQDPVNQGLNTISSDLVRRATYLSGLLPPGGSCPSDLLLRSLVTHKVNFSH